MGTGAQASSAVLVDVNGIDGCRFTWVLPSAGSEIVTVDSGGIFHFHSESARLLEGFSTPEAVATIDSVTLVAHASEIVEASEGGAVTSAGVSTKTDASTVTWTNVRDDVTATGTVNADAAAASPTPSVSPTPSPSPSPSRERGGGSSRSSLTPIFADLPAASSPWFSWARSFSGLAGRVRRRPTPNSTGMHPCERRSARPPWRRRREQRPTRPPRLGPRCRRSRLRRPHRRPIRLAKTPRICRRPRSPASASLPRRVTDHSSNARVF